jgi:co-chaperonin GroES (HSP10)
MHYLRIKPNVGHVLVQHCIQERIEIKTDGGIFIPQPAQGKEDSMRRAVVLAVGKDTEGINVNDFVYVHIHAGTPIELMQQARRSSQQGILRIVKATEISCVATLVGASEKDTFGVIEAMDVVEMTTLKYETKPELKLVKPSTLILPEGI